PHLPAIGVINKRSAGWDACGPSTLPGDWLSVTLDVFLILKGADKLKRSGHRQARHLRST
ncbi:MAG TPA: hypothetical protein VJ372_12330, partial [Pyrinomonadaceae bacterium]|nr:hypothetical protein [Pyrinomonadaceae bacterium]